MDRASFLVDLDNIIELKIKNGVHFIRQQTGERITAYQYFTQAKKILIDVANRAFENKDDSSELFYGYENRSKDWLIDVLDDWLCEDDEYVEER